MKNHFSSLFKLIAFLNFNEVLLKTIIWDFSRWHHFQLTRQGNREEIRCPRIRGGRSWQRTVLLLCNQLRSGGIAERDVSGVDGHATTLRLLVHRVGCEKSRRWWHRWRRWWRRGWWRHNYPIRILTVMMMMITTMMTFDTWWFSWSGLKTETSAKTVVVIALTKGV